MPISVECPSCSARVNAPDAAAGKRVRCPKCQQPIPVPAAAADDGFEVVDDAPPAPKRKVAVEDDEDDRPRKKPSRRAEDEEDEDERPRAKKGRRDEEDEDEERPAKKSSRRAGAAKDEDEDDDRPRKRKATGRPGKRGPSAGSKTPLLIGGAVLGVIVLVVGGVFLFGGGGKPGAPGGIADKAPAGFTGVRDADGAFAVYLPGSANKVQVKVNNQDGAALGHHEWMSMSGQFMGNDHREFWVRSRKLEANFNPGTSPEQLYTLLGMYEHDVKDGNTTEVVSKRPLTMGGQPALEVRVKEKPFLMSSPGDNGFFKDADARETERVRKDGRMKVFYVTTDGKRAFTIRIESKTAFVPDDVLKVIADSFTLL